MSPPVPSKKWRSDSADLKNSYAGGGENYKDYGYGDNSEYRQSEKPARSNFDRSNDYNEYDEYDRPQQQQYDDYDQYEQYDQYDSSYDDGSSEYANSKKQNFGGKDNNWKEDGYQGGGGGRFQNNERRFGGTTGRGNWNKGGFRNDYPADDPSYRQPNSTPTHLSRDDGGKRSAAGPNQQSDSYYGDRPSRFSDADRNSRSRTSPVRGRGRSSSSSYPRRPYAGARGGGGSADSYAGSRYSGSSDRYAENDDEYYDRGGGSNRDQSDEYYDSKWPAEDRASDEYYDGGEVEHYDEYADEGGSNYRGGRYQGSRGRGSDRGARRNFNRGGSTSSWRGSRGKDAPRRSRGRGGRRQ